MKRFFAAVLCLMFVSQTAAAITMGPADGSSTVTIKGEEKPYEFPTKLKLRDASQAEKFFYAGDFDAALKIFMPMGAAGDRNFALFQNQIGSIWLAKGDYDQALDAFLKSYYLMNDTEAFTELEKHAASLAGSESDKAYKGDPYEKAFNALYVSLLLYGGGDVENALAAAKTGILADSDVKSQMYRCDMTALYALAARLAAKSGDAQTSAGYREQGFRAYTDTLVATRPIIHNIQLVVSEENELQEEVRAIQEKYKNRKKLPKRAVKKLDELGARITALQTRIKDLEAQKAEIARQADTAGLDNLVNPENNLLICLELSHGPLKYNVGEYGEMAVFASKATQVERIALAIDEQMYPGSQLVSDPYFQATTRGGRMMDGILKGQAEFKKTTAEVGQQMAQQSQEMMNQANQLAAAGVDSTALAGAAAAMAVVSLASSAMSAIANPTADIRHWSLMPGELVLIACKANPGTRDIGLNFTDCKGRPVGALNFKVDVAADGDTVCFARFNETDGI